MWKRQDVDLNLKGRNMQAGVWRERDSNADGLGMGWPVGVEEIGRRKYKGCGERDVGKEANDEGAKITRVYN